MTYISTLISLTREEMIILVKYCFKEGNDKLGKYFIDRLPEVEQ